MAGVRGFPGRRRPDLHLEISSAEQTLAKDCHIFAANGDTHFKLVAPLPPVDTHFVMLYVSVIDQYPNLSAEDSILAKLKKTIGRVFAENVRSCRT